MFFFHHSEKRSSHSQTTVIAPLAITYPKQDISGYPLPDLDHATKKPKSRKSKSRQTKPDVSCNPSKRPVLQITPENKEGEDLVEQIQQLKAALIKSNSDLHQQQQTTQSVEQREKLQVERNETLTKELLEQTTNNEQLRQQVSSLLAEKEELTAQLELDRVQTNEAIEMMAGCYAKKVRKLKKEFADANKSDKPITKEMGCGPDVDAVATTQTESIVKDVGTPQVIPPRTRTTQQPRRSGFIPARESTESAAVPASAPKPKVHFPVGDIRYKDKPMSGYVVNPDGTQVTYGDAVPSTRKPAVAIPTNSKEAAGPLVLEQPKPKPYTNNGPVKIDDLVITTTPVERISLPGNRLMLKNVPEGDYGKIIGGGGSNIRRLETRYQIVARINTSPDGNVSFLITGNTEEVRQAAADDVVDGLTVTAEFPNSKLLKRIKTFRLHEIGRKYFVRINRPSDINGMITLTGRLGSCQSAYAEMMGQEIN
ncbi:hypothetical protein DAPPUDRAFT_119190 [Daphnia pulex]|uniref:Leucine zipper transcription factor-like protein 1 n=1 Tax=Daphnia pulex TaxID=6669 RepID=E9HXS2_DAPPU|nr:hypothetical protein DAPPUDRAFT_119190 [Daphnia pulex]|eukprot:EFX63459.1 hypothetical protein DAPPUDRAFT_119190 [Daphnia pulex]